MIDLHFYHQSKLIYKQSLIDKITEKKINEQLNYEIILNNQKVNDSKKIILLKNFIKLSNTRQILLHEKKTKAVSSFNDSLKIFEETMLSL